MQRIKQDVWIGKNIRTLRINKGITQAELARRLQLKGCDMTRECLVKIERGIQHIKASQMIYIKQELQVSYEELFAQQEDE